MSSIYRIERHRSSLIKRYLADKPVPFDEYLNTVLCCCPTERHVAQFVESGMTLEQLIDASPVTSCDAWYEADETVRETIVVEAKLVLLKAWAEDGQKGYGEVCDHVAAMIGMGFRERGCTTKRRNRIVGAHFASTQGRFRGQFVRAVVVVKGREILEELAHYYSLMSGEMVTSDQLLREAGEG